MSWSAQQQYLSAPEIDIEMQSPLWRNEPAAEQTIRDAIAAAARLTPAAGEVSVLLTDDAAIQALNKRWRSIDRPTNVLSFPAQANSRLPAPLLGDIVIAYETLARESQMERKPFLHHLTHLAVHGFLHLLGYDHETDAQAEAMEDLEREILARLAIADPYRAPQPGNA